MTTSPLLEALGARLDGYDAAHPQLSMSFAPPILFRQGAGMVQGGALSMMLDFVMASVGKAGSVATVSMATEYMGPALGEDIRAEAVVERAGRRMVFTRGWLFDGAKKVAAAQSSLMVLPA